jgi:hypothetical protein
MLSFYFFSVAIYNQIIHTSIIQIPWPFYKCQFSSNSLICSYYPCHIKVRLVHLLHSHHLLLFDDNSPIIMCDPVVENLTIKSPKKNSKWPWFIIINQFYRRIMIQSYNMGQMWSQYNRSQY